VPVPVDVQFAGTPASLGEEEIVGWAEAVMRRMGDDPERVSVCVRVVAEEESGELNARYRDQHKPTNVLSFQVDISLPEEKLLGDIVICEQVVRREAQEQCKRADEHFAHMVVHGMLHLYGYDHQDPVDAGVMENIEREVLASQGIADPYGVT